MTIALQHIFTSNPDKHLYQKHELLGLEIQSKFINSLAQELNMVFQGDNIGDGNTCFAGDSGLRQDFKTVFTNRDISYYAFGLIEQTQVDLRTEHIALPTDSDSFWTAVVQGETQIKISKT